MSLDTLPKELILIILNKFDHEATNGYYNHPSRRNVLNIYCTSKIFNWLAELIISSVEELEIHTAYSTFNIFGQKIGLQFESSNYANYCVNGVSGISYEINGRHLYYMHLFLGYDGSSYGNYYFINDTEGYIDDHEDIVKFLQEIVNQCEKLDSEFYEWYMSGSRKLLIRDKYDHDHDHDYDFTLLNHIYNKLKT